MSTVSPPLSEDEDRVLDCMSAIESSFASVEKAAVEVGWRPIEVALAMLDLSRMRLQALIEAAETKGSRGSWGPH